MTRVLRLSDGEPAGEASFNAVGCAIIVAADVLLLRRNPGKVSALRWGLPGGKTEQGESAFDAVVREINEETGITVDPSNLSHRERFFIEDDPANFLFTLFTLQVGGRPKITLAPNEHLASAWVPLAEALTLPLVAGTRECLVACSEYLPLHVQDQLFEFDDHPLFDKIDPNERLVRRETLHVQARSSDPVRIAVIGPPGAGKTSLIAGLKSELPSEWGYVNRRFGRDRHSRQHRYLTAYLSGDPRFAFLCQIESLSNRYWQVLDTPSPAVISDEWITSSLAYTRALRLQEDLTDDEYQTFYFTYMALQKSLGHPTLTIHLTASSGVLRQRIQKRGRKLENTSHTEHYLERLRRAFKSVAQEVGDEATVIDVDTSLLRTVQVLETVLNEVRPLWPIKMQS